MDFNYQVDIRGLRRDELIVVLLRLGMRCSVVRSIFTEKSLHTIKRIGKLYGVQPVSGRRPVGGIYAKSIYGRGADLGLGWDGRCSGWNAFTRFRAIRFFESWLTFKEAKLNDICAFALAWQKSGGGILNINRCWVLTQQNEYIEVKTCRCGEKFLREKWMVGLHQCQFCSGELLKTCRHTKKLKHLTWQGDSKEEVLDCLHYLET